MSEEYEIEMSPLSQRLDSDGKSVQIDIYRGDQGGWILEVVDEFGNSTLWSDEFATDVDALNEVKKTVKQEGINSLIGLPSDKLLWAQDVLNASS